LYIEDYALSRLKIEKYLKHIKMNYALYILSFSTKSFKKITEVIWLKLKMFALDS